MLVRNDHQVCLYPVEPELIDRTSDLARSSAACSAMATPGPTDLPLLSAHAFVMSLSLSVPGSGKGGAEHQRVSLKSVSHLSPLSRARPMPRSAPRNN